MSLREYYNKLVLEYFENKKIDFKYKCSKYSDYYYILNIRHISLTFLKIKKVLVIH